MKLETYKCSSVCVAKQAIEKLPYLHGSPPPPGLSLLLSLWRHAMFLKLSRKALLSNKYLKLLAHLSCSVSLSSSKC